MNNSQSLTETNNVLNDITNSSKRRNNHIDPQVDNVEEDLC